MSILRRMRDWLTNTEKGPSDNQTSPEDDSELLGKILWEVLVEQGVRPNEMRIVNIRELFDAWYDGPCTKEAVAAAIPEFKKSHSISFSYEG